MNNNLIGAFIVLFFVFVPLERLFPLHREQGIFRKGWGNDLVHFMVNKFFLQIGLVFTVGTLSILLHGLISPNFQAAVAAQPKWLQFVEAVFLADLGFYCAHRLTHTIPWLWKFHAVHHSIEEMDWLAAARLHPIDQIFNRTMTILPLYLMGFTKATLGFYLALASFQALFIHSNVRFKFGPLRWLFATPEFHHWHHSKDREALNKNFAGQLPWLDWLLGTLHMPKGKMPDKYGVDEEIPQNYLKQMKYPFERNRDD